MRNLFSQIILSYAVDCFIGSYGHTETIIKEDEFLIDGYICSSYENENFYSANKYQNNYFWYASIQTLFEEEYLLSIKPTINYEDKNKVLKDNKIVQLKYKYNSNLQNRDMNLVLGWFKEYFEIDKNNKLK